VTRQRHEAVTPLNTTLQIHFWSGKVNLLQCSLWSRCSILHGVKQDIEFIVQYILFLRWCSKMEGFILLEMCLLHRVHTYEQHKKTNMIQKVGLEFSTEVVRKSPVYRDVACSVPTNCVYKRYIVHSSLLKVNFQRTMIMNNPVFWDISQICTVKLSFYKPRLWIILSYII
jgi:hypothetical protein